MRNEALDQAIERLASDRRFRRRFRRSPARALRGSGLGEAEIEALKGGRAEELLELGMDPSYPFPAAPLRAAPLQMWTLRNARRLVPAALLASATLAFAAAPAPAARRSAKTKAGSKVKVKKVSEKPQGRVLFKAKVESNKGKCERRRPMEVRARFPRVFGNDFFPIAAGRTNRKGILKLTPRFVPPTAVFDVIAVAPKKKVGKTICKRSESPTFRVKW